MTYSMDLRQRVVAAVEAGESIAAVARRFNVARPTVRDWRDRDRRGQLEPGVPGPKGSVKLTEADDQVMREAVAKEPSITAKQLIPMLSVQVVASTVCRALTRLGLSRKKSH
jgi:putative transposase